MSESSEQSAATQQNIQAIEVDARVFAVEQGTAWVEMKPHKSCPNCDPVHGCRSLSIARLFASGRKYQVRDDVGVSVGDAVIVAIPPQAVLRSAMLAYVVPLFALLSGAILGAKISEWGSIVGSLGCFFGALWVVRRRAARLQDDPDFQPRIIRRVVGFSLSCSERASCS